MWDGHLESQKNPDRLKRSIHVDRIGVHSTFVCIYAVPRVLMIWANCFFLLKCLFFLEKVEDVTTISKSQSLTSVSIKDCTLRVPNKTTTLFLLRAIIKAIFTSHRTSRHVTPRHTTSSHATPHHITPCHTTLSHATPAHHVTPHHFTSHHLKSPHVTARHAA